MDAILRRYSWASSWKRTYACFCPMTRVRCCLGATRPVGETARDCTLHRDHRPARMASSVLSLKCRTRNRWIGWNCKWQFNLPCLAPESPWRETSISDQCCCQGHRRLKAVSLPGQSNPLHALSFQPKVRGNQLFQGEQSMAPNSRSCADCVAMQGSTRRWQPRQYCRRHALREVS